MESVITGLQVCLSQEIVSLHLLLLWVHAMLMFVCPDIQPYLKSTPPKKKKISHISGGPVPLVDEMLAHGWV